MKYLNSNACIVLKNIIDKENNRGLVAIRGMTRRAILNKCNENKPKEKQISPSTVSRALKVLENEGFVKEGVKVVKLTTYYITDKGLNYLDEIKGVRINE